MALALFGLILVMSALTVVLYGGFGSPSDMAVAVGIVAACTAIRLAVDAAWQRLTKNRRRDRLGG